ncbi:MAG: preprotein translocase subunit YajC [Acutalibacteraceae bacterium]
MNLFFHNLASTTKTAGQAAQQSDPWSMLLTFLPLILIVVVMYFLMIRPQRKQQKKEQEMRNNIRVGDQITTIGGICGRVVKVSEEELVIETGADRNKMSIKKWAIQTNDTVHEKEAVDDDDDDDDDDD